MGWAKGHDLKIGDSYLGTFTIKLTQLYKSVFYEQSL